MGTFFQDTHRDYIVFDSIPEQLVQAIVSAEDKNFYKHAGVDYKAILHAFLDDIKSLSLKRGGSSLTQQTAKNLFPSPGRGKLNRLIAKIPELINAFRLERNFTKDQILEFYLNQFYVSSNGHGVGIAARYFFGKELPQLGLLELAFIAGSVKGPNKYNPFLAVSKSSKEKKIKNARFRTRYVLLKMKENKFISSQTFDSTVQKLIPFSKGEFQYKLSTNIVKVKQFLESKEILGLLQNYGVSNYKTSGIQIITSIDAKLQKACEYATYKNLSRLSLILEGYLPPKKKSMDILSEFEPERFYTGKICSTVSKNGLPEALQIQFGSVKGWVDKKALKEFRVIWNQYNTGIRREPSRKAALKIFSNFQKENLVYCSSKSIVGPAGPKKGNLEIEQIPTLQGGSRILKDGRIIANVGGFQNIGYDRVNQAVRQFGSTFKPLVYAAAFELGWHPLDTLTNYRQLFKLGTTFYFPRPDHKPEPYVSIAWAGRKSENIASVYLLYNMMDKLSFTEFWKFCKSLRLHPENFNSRQEYVFYIRDSLGINLTKGRLMEIEYTKIVQELSADLIFDGFDEQAAYLTNLPYGLGYKQERENMGKISKENKIRNTILEKNYLDFMDFVNSKKASIKYQNLTRNTFSIFSVAPGSEWSRYVESEIPTGKELYLNGVIKLKILKEIQNKLESKPIKKDGYSPENLFYLDEFRAMAAIIHTIQFSKKMGIKSDLEPVLSFPLGSNVITLSEATEFYQTLKTGLRFRSQKTGKTQLLIEKIKLPSGKIIFQNKINSKKVLEEYSKASVRSILRSIVDGGTGSKVMRNVKIYSNQKDLNFSLGFQCYGKTGTTNNHRNGAFLGHISGPSGKNGLFSSDSGYTIGVYVGFDDNRKMENKGFKGFGSTVSLDAWILIANSIVKIKKYHENVDFLDLNTQVNQKVPLDDSGKIRIYKVNKKNGLPVNDNNSDNLITTSYYIREN